MEEANWNLLDWQVLGVIPLTLTKNMAHNVAEAETTIDMMNTLSNMYEKSFANNWVFLMKKLFNLKMREDTSAIAQLNELNTIISQMMFVEINFDDKVLP